MHEGSRKSITTPDNYRRDTIEHFEINVFIDGLIFLLIPIFRISEIRKQYLNNS